MPNVKDDGTAATHKDLAPAVEKTKGHVQVPNTSPLQRQETADARAARRERQTDLQNDEEDRNEREALARGETPNRGGSTTVEKTITRDQQVKPRHERESAQATAREKAQAEDGAPQAGNDPEQYKTGSQPAVQDDKKKL